MSERGGEGMDAEDESTPKPAGALVPTQLTDEMRTSYINYAMSVIVGRALPDVRDGLKPVHRRVLYGMHEAGHVAGRAYAKSARSVGEVMGKFHPHGDSSIYETMVRMAQAFSLRYPLVDGQGNFGSIDGDPPAAMRYTESRLGRIAAHMLDDIDKETVAFQPNFDDSEQEPTVLPARLPNLLLNGSDGIAVGMATRIPPHNLEELAAAIALHVDAILEGGLEGDATALPPLPIDAYLEVLPGPDFPTGATIHGSEGIRSMYATGKGRFHVRAKASIVENATGGSSIVVTEIPYQVKKAGMLEATADLIRQDRITGIRDIRDESSKDGLRIVFEVKQNADANAVLNQLYLTTRLQESYAANMMGIVDGQPTQLTLPVILHAYVRHREEVVVRRTEFDLEKAERRMHILEGLIRAQDRIDDVIAAGRSSESKAQFERVLMGQEIIDGIAPFDFSEVQARSIAERRLYQLSRMDVQSVKDEHEALSERILDLRDLLGSRARRLRVLVDELNDVTRNHGDQRRTGIVNRELSMDPEDLVAEEAVVITLSEGDYVRRIPVEAFRTQNRGGRGLRGLSTKEEDAPQLLRTCFSKDRLLIFTDAGRVYGLRAWEVPQGSRASRGTPIINLLPAMRDDERVIAILPLPSERIEEAEGRYLVFATRMGRVKRTAMKEYVNINRNGKYALRFASEEDGLVRVTDATQEDDILLVSDDGMACRFAASGVRPQGRIATGVRGIRLKDGAKVVGMVCTNDVEAQVLTITRQGMAKRSRLGTGLMHEEGSSARGRDGYRRTNRGAKGVRTMRLEEQDEIVSVVQLRDPRDQLFLLTATGMMIRIRAGQTKETTGKVTKGTRVMELRDDAKRTYTDAILATARLPQELLDLEEE